MKDLLKKVESFIMFDFALDPEYIGLILSVRTIFTKRVFQGGAQFRPGRK